MMKDVGRKMEAELTKTSDVYYPRLTLDLDDFPEFNSVGKEVTLTVKGYVKSVSKSDDRGTVDLEIYEVGSSKNGNKADESYSKMRGNTK